MKPSIFCEEKNMRKLFVLMSLLVLASMVLAACGGAAPATNPPAAATEPPAAATQPPATGATEAPAATGPKSADPTTFVLAEPGLSIDTLDPALAYDNASGEIIFNTYETLVFYDGEATDKFVPILAESWETSEDGKTWTFKIREGVKFHNGDTMTPTDVAYSFQRGLLQGGTASPQWLLTEPFFGVGIDDVSLLVDPEGGLYDDREALSAADPAKLMAACEQVQNAIVADDAAGTVTMTLAQPWGPFLVTIPQSWGSVLDKKWVAENKGWDGTCETWQNFYAMDSASDPISGIENGTGPFKLDGEIKQGEQWSLVRNDDYWREPAKLERVIVKDVEEWGTRFTMLQTGDADVATVQVADRGQADEYVGESCEFDLASNSYKPCEVTDDSMPLRLHIGRPGVQADVLGLNQKIATSAESPNPYLGSGKLDGNGIPADFFADVHIRKAFAYCFDYDTLINDVFNGEAVQPVGLPLPGMPGYFPDIPHYTTDLDKCTEEFKLADLDHDGVPAGDDPEGDVWTTGFRVQMAYNQGNNTRQTIAEILSGNLATVNELFSLETLGLPWASYLRAQRAAQLPVLTAGWIEDIHDPHNWYQPYTLGAYGGRFGLSDDIKAQFRDILARGVAEVDPAKRAEIYQEANQLYYDQAVGIPLYINTSHAYEQRWVQGRVYNPIFGTNLYYYTISKN
jgi:peptide/nickel transport system substrate-binding protein